MAWKKHKYERNVLLKDLTSLLLLKLTILKPKNKNVDIWNSSGDVESGHLLTHAIAAYFWGYQSKKWCLCQRNCGCVVCFDPFQLSSDIKCTVY